MSVPDTITIHTAMPLNLLTWFFLDYILPKILIMLEYFQCQFGEAKNLPQTTFFWTLDQRICSEQNFVTALTNCTLHTPTYEKRSFRHHCVIYNELACDWTEPLWYQLILLRLLLLYRFWTWMNHEKGAISSPWRSKRPSNIASSFAESIQECNSIEIFLQ